MRVEKTLVMNIGDMVASEGGKISCSDIGTSPIWIFEDDFPLTYAWLKNNGELDLTDVDNVKILDDVEVSQ